MEAWEGRVSGADARARGKRTPRRASWSRLGVDERREPEAPTKSPRNVSRVISRTGGLSLGAPAERTIETSRKARMS
jgi:hypothetical protein